MTATPESPVGEEKETKGNSESAELKTNGTTVHDEKSPALENLNHKENEMPPNEADLGTGKASTPTETAPLASSEDLKVKFSGGARGSLGDAKDVKIEISSVEKTPVKNDFPALTKAELMVYAKDPFWIGLRWGLFILFWAIWLAMLVASIVIIVIAPKCPPPAPKQWWQKAPIYEVYVKSFKDTDGDGVGDINGVTTKLDYLVQLGVGSVYLSPVYESGNKDNGYDVIDHSAIDPKLGTLEDFKALITALHDNGIKLIMEFIPNHSSDQHAWFKKSVRREEPYTDYYIWKECSRSSTPNNWLSVFGGSAWEYNSERGQCYLHQFYKEQPDLNLRNEKVVEEMENIMNFWLDLGVDGFRIDSVGHFFEDAQLKDERAKDSGRGYEKLEHKHTYDQPEVLDLLAKFRAVLDSKTEEDSYNPRIMMTEADLPVEEVGKYYGINITDQIGTLSHMPLFFDMITNFKPNGEITSEQVASTIQNYVNGLPVDEKLGRAWPNYNSGNHDSSRCASRFGHQLVDAMNMVVMMLQGSPITYYGDEIGMEDYSKASANEPEPKRNLYRTPMQWDTTNHAGFTEGDKPWLPVNPNYEDINVATEEAAANSHLKVYQELAKLRHSDSILYGDTEFFTNGSFFGYTRVKKGNPGYLVAVNFGDEAVTTDVTGMDLMPSRATVQLRDTSNNKTERSLPLSELTLEPKEGMILAFVPDFSKTAKVEEKTEEVVKEGEGPAQE